MSSWRIVSRRGNGLKSILRGPSSWAARMPLKLGLSLRLIFSRQRHLGDTGHDVVVGCGLVVLVLVGDEAGWLRAPIVASSPVKPSLVLAILPMAAPRKRFETAGCSRISSIQPKEIGRPQSIRSESAREN